LGPAESRTARLPGSGCNSGRDCSEAEEAFDHFCSPGSAEKWRRPHGRSLWQWPGTELWGGEHRLQICAPASRSRTAGSAGPSKFVHPGQLTAGCTNPPGKQGGRPVSRSLQPPRGWPAARRCAADSTAFIAVSPGAAPHVSYYPALVDTKVYSNPSGTGTAVYLGPLLGNGPACCLISLDNNNYSRAPEALLLQITSDRMRGNGFKLCQGRFRLDTRKKFLTESMVWHWNRLSSAVVQSPSLEVFRKLVDIALQDMV